MLPYDERFSKFDEAGAAGIAVMVIKDGETVFQKGYGLRNIARKERVDPDTNFRLASVTKQFTAMCVAILEERQMLQSSDLISKYFNDLPAYMDTIRVEHLVHHTSGLPDYGEVLWSYDESKPLLSNQDMYDYYKTLDSLDSQPGEIFEYSNGGYSLLAMLIENVSGQSFHQFTKENIFAPLAMNSTLVVSDPEKINNRAESYSEWPFFEDIGFNTANTIYGEDGIYSSLRDLELWIKGLVNNTLISPSMTEKVFSRTKDNDGEDIDYGYGWGFEDFYGYPMIHHTGGWVGFNTVIANIPEQDIWFVVLSNTNAIDSWNIMEECAKHHLDISIGTR